MKPNSLLPLLLLVATCVWAQSWTGSVAGEVRDESGRPVAAANVVLISDETDRRREVAADSEGWFAIPRVAPGPYHLEISHEGFRTHSQNLVMVVNQQVSVEISLIVGRRNEEVFVTAGRELLRTETASLSTVVETHQIRGLPLDGRNFFELALLAPGAAPSAQGSPGTVRGDFALHVNGSREDSNNFVLDGVYSGDPKLNGTGVTPQVDAIREFEVLGSTYDASFGRNAGGQINVVTKSGTNQFHGTGYEFFRNAALDARNFFAPGSEPKPRYQRSQFGGSFGGPLVRDRLFFFTDYEGRRNREGITRLANVPTQAERNGDFSASPRPVIDPFTQQPFPGNLIPIERQHPIGRNIAALYPLPNRAVPLQNFVSSPALRDRNDAADIRLDAGLGAADDLSIRYSFGDRTLYEPFSGSTFALVPGYGTDVLRRAQNAMLAETHAFSPAWINELRLAFNRIAAGTFHENQGRSINREVGLPELSSKPRDWGLSLITVTGYSPLGDEYNNPQHSVTNTYQVSDNLSWARGRHLARFGFDFRYLQQNAFRDVQSRGFLNFLGITLNPLADLIIGMPAFTGGARLDNHQHLRNTSLNFYAQDTWRLTPHLTLIAGMRYEYNSPAVDAFDRANLYDISTGGLVPVGTGNIPRGGYLPDRNNFAPRAGVAYTPDRNTVLRAGYGFYFDQSALAPSEGLYFNAPYFDLRFYFIGRGLPPLFLDNPFPENFPVPLPTSAQAFQRDLRTPYVQHWNFSVQRQVGRGRVAEVAYVGSKGTKLLSGRDINQPRPSPIQPNPRPNPMFDDINRNESRSNSSYNSLQARFQQQVRDGFSVLAAYTWAKSIDDASNYFASAGDPSYPQDSFNTSAERARSSFDVAHRLSAAWSWDLPIARGHRYLGGWQNFGILTLQAGRPFTVALLPELDNSNTGRAQLGFGANDRPNVLRNPSLPDPSPERWFDTSAFVTPAFGSFGNAGRNILEGPGSATLNLSVLKDTALSERLTLQFRAEAFNLFNRTNFDLPDLFAGSPTFGRVQSAQSPRRVQFGLKLLF